MSNKSKIEQAVQEYLDRQAWIRRPKGKADRAGRWYPADEEVRDCCVNIRTPSRNHPHSYLNHCRTIKHIAQLFGVSESELRKEVQKRQK